MRLIRSVVVAAAVVATIACRSSVDAPHGQIRVVGTTTSTDGPNLLATYTVRNDSNATRRYDFGYPGPLSIRVYAQGALVWDSRGYFDPILKPQYGQFAYVGAGMSYQFSTTIPVDIVLGDSLPTGSYTGAVSGAVTPALPLQVPTPAVKLVKLN